MDAIANPYTPNAGTRPKELAGRDAEIEAFRVLVARLKRGNPEKSQILTGLRGVGKTVLLNAFHDHAEAEGFVPIQHELTPETDIAELLAREARYAFGLLKPSARVASAIKTGLSRLSSFTVTDPSGYEFGVGVAKPSEDALARDFGEIFTQLGVAAQDKGVGVIFLLDEIQFIGEVPFRAIIAGLHRAAQRNLPITLAGAGLPQVPRLAGEAKSYAERLFDFPKLGHLDEEAARAALAVPAKEEGVEWTEEAVARVVELTEGYPFYLQEFGKHIWNVAGASPITLDDVDKAEPVAQRALDRGIYQVRIQRANPGERDYLRAMAELGRGPYRSGDVAKKLGKTVSGVSTVRQSLMEKGLIYATELFGYLDFTIPMFDQFMRRFMPFTSPATGTGKIPKRKPRE